MINISKIKIGDKYKKHGSNIVLEVTETGTEHGFNFVKLYNDVTDQTQKLVSLKHYSKV